MIDPDEPLLGTLTAAELLALPDEAELGAAARRKGVRVLPSTDQEKMASIALRQGVCATPVVDEADRLVGVVRPTRLMKILRREHVDDLHPWPASRASRTGTRGPRSTRRPFAASVSVVHCSAAASKAAAAPPAPN